jgi:transcriptional regulator with XRE-family HTH domain
MTRQSLGYNLAHLRTRAGMTQVVLAKRSGISRSTITFLETRYNGHDNAKLETLRALARALGVTVADIIGTDKRPSRSA